MANLIKELKEQEGFSDSEKMIADFLLENYRGLAALSTRQLAKLTYTSSAAIVRFSQKMGFEGYTDFKIQFMAEMMQYVNQPRQDEGLTNKDTVRMIMDKVTHMEINALKDTHAGLQPVLVVKAIEAIKAAGHLDFYATDDNYNIANLAASSFIMVDKSYSLTASVGQMYMMAAGAPKGHLSIFISRTGENRMLVDMARTIRSKGGKILLITSETDTTLGGLADIMLPVASVKKLEELGPRIFLAGAKYVVDVLFASLVAQKGLKDVSQRDNWLKLHFQY